ncbi:MAG: hypothetical protein KHX22_07780, partial [Clostridiales bacterium]|nr:hypothetical protein [Clostridiales bacterium]
MFGDLALQLSKRTGADIPDVPGGALFIPCHGFGGLAVDHGAKQNLSLQLGQPKQCVMKFLTQIHLFFVKYFSLKKASEFPFFSKGFSLPSAGIMHPC